ncbi:MAG: hypothetical protein AAB548_02035 [Patescibacteria group bacterium]
MSETARIDETHLNLQVGKNITIDNPYSIILDKGREVKPKDVSELLKKKHGLNSYVNVELKKRTETQHLSEGLIYAQDRAKDLISRIRLEIGLPAIEKNDMMCVYYTDTEFDQEMFTTALIFGFYDADGVSDPALIADIVRMRDYPSYVVASLAAHELIHRFIDLNVNMYQERQIPGNSNQKELKTDFVRGGLVIKDAKSRNTKRELLSELGNFYVQACFLREMIGDTNPLIKNEMSDREDRVRAEFGDGIHVSTVITLASGKKVHIVFGRDKLHPSKEKILFNVRATMMMQLADDINHLCGDVDGMPFMNLVLKAKADPKHLTRIKRIIDEKIGNGFFDKLSKTNYKGEGDFEDLLVEVQRKIYTFS